MVLVGYNNTSRLMYASSHTVEAHHICNGSKLSAVTLTDYAKLKTGTFMM